MANSLLNGTAPGETSAPAPDPNEGKTPTWGYRRTDGEGQIFWLADGETLPDGFENTPAKCGPNAAASVEPVKPAEPTPKRSRKEP
jgi:hypothetical protein